MPAKMDLLGKKFGKLTVIGIAESKLYPSGKHANWKCLCECGKTKEITALSLRAGTQTCGCLHKETVRQLGKNTSLGIGVSAFNTLLASYKIGARKRNVDFSLSKEEFSNLISKNCYYCGSIPASIYKKSTGNLIYNGIDRIDNNLGYSLNNVVTCCVTCNYAKNKLTQSKFFEMIKNIYERHLK